MVVAVKEKTAKPFIKWVGSKTQLLPELLKRVPENFAAYHEPFLGGGALYWALQPQLSEAHLSDVNAELIGAYSLVRNSPDMLADELEKLDSQHGEDQFYSVRAWDRGEYWDGVAALYRAARFIYLNKTCFNGLHRVNKKGQFNVPIGRYKNPAIYDNANLEACSKALQNASLSVAPFTRVEDDAVIGDFVYFDPPYAPVSATADFTSYTKDGFDVDQQIKLRDLCVKLDRENVSWMLSNSSAPLIHELYKDFHIETVHARRSVNSKASKRGAVEEVIVRNYQ